MVGKVRKAFFGARTTVQKQIIENLIKAAAEKGVDIRRNRWKRYVQFRA